VGGIEMLKEKPVPLPFSFTRDHTWTCLGSNSGLWWEISAWLPEQWHSWWCVHF